MGPEELQVFSESRCQSSGKTVILPIRQQRHLVVFFVVGLGEWSLRVSGHPSFPSCGCGNKAGM